MPEFRFEDLLPHCQDPLRNSGESNLDRRLGLQLRHWGEDHHSNSASPQPLHSPLKERAPRPRPSVTHDGEIHPNPPLWIPKKKEWTHRNPWGGWVSRTPSLNKRRKEHLQRPSNESPGWTGPKQVLLLGERPMGPLGPFGRSMTHRTVMRHTTPVPTAHPVFTARVRAVGSRRFKLSCIACRCFGFFDEMPKSEGIFLTRPSRRGHEMNLM